MIYIGLVIDALVINSCGAIHVYKQSIDKTTLWTVLFGQYYSNQASYYSLLLTWPNEILSQFYSLLIYILSHT